MPETCVKSLLGDRKLRSCSSCFHHHLGPHIAFPFSFPQVLFLFSYPCQLEEARTIECACKIFRRSRLVSARQTQAEIYRRRSDRETGRTNSAAEKTFRARQTATRVQAQLMVYS